MPSLRDLTSVEVKEDYQGIREEPIEILKERGEEEGEKMKKEWSSSFYSYKNSPGLLLLKALLVSWYDKVTDYWTK